MCAKVSHEENEYLILLEPVGTLQDRSEKVKLGIEKTCNKESLIHCFVKLAEKQGKLISQISPSILRGERLFLDEIDNYIEEHNHGLSIEVLKSKTITTYTPPAWDKLSNYTKALFHQEVLHQQPYEPIPFTLNFLKIALPSTIEPTKIIPYLTKKINYQLKQCRKELARDIDYWFHYDIAKGKDDKKHNACGVLHLHGSMAITDNEWKAIVKPRLHKINDDEKLSKRLQAVKRSSITDPKKKRTDLEWRNNWPSYATKSDNEEMADQYHQKFRQFLKASGNSKNEAKKLYNELKEVIIDCQK